MGYQEIIEKWGVLAKQYAIGNSLEWSLVLAVIKQESSGSEKAISTCGARGLMQLMQGAVADYNSRHREVVTWDQVFVGNINIRVGCWYLRHLITRWRGDVEKGLQSYNQGFSRVKGDPNAGRWYSDGVLKHKAEFDKIVNKSPA